MTRMLLATNLLIAAISVSGCATCITGKYQNIHVTSKPSGAKVTVNGITITAPGSFKLVRNQDYTLVAEYPGAEPQHKQLKHGLQGWFWGNILLVSPTGCAIDMASARCDELIPDKVHFDFTSAGTAEADRKRAYLESHPSTTDEIRFAILNELSAKGMTEEELQASLGPPDKVAVEREYEKLTYSKRKPQRYYFKNGILEKANSAASPPSFSLF